MNVPWNSSFHDIFHAVSFFDKGKRNETMKEETSEDYNKVKALMFHLTESGV